MSKFKAPLFLAGISLIAIAAPAFADPPGRVGRVSLIEGSLSMKDDDTGGWDYASLNEPVTTGDAFWAEQGSRGEMQVGGASVRVDGGTEVDVVRLDDGATELNVPQGAVSVEIAYPPPGGVVIDTPQGKVTMTRPGLYSIVAHAGDSDSIDTAQLTVYRGDAAVDSLNSHVDLQRGQSALWSSSPPSFNMVAAQESAFDQWVRQRDRASSPEIDAQYITPDMTGYQDLGAYGSWNSVPQYGTVWYPNDVGSDWAPYRDGRWDYVRPWGWTWIDSHPWGFAPFHYGRWVQTGGRWGWWPGEQPRAPRPVYAPALVAFLSFGHGQTTVSVSQGPVAGGPAVGWVPLAPYEVYRPWYSRDPGYWQRVNRPFVRQAQVNNINVTTINNNVTVNTYTYSNRAAALAVPAAAFGHGGDRGRTAPQRVPPGSVPQSASIDGVAAAPPPAPGDSARHGHAERIGGWHHGAGENAAPAPTAANAPRPVATPPRQDRPPAVLPPVFAPSPDTVAPLRGRHAETPRPLPEATAPHPEPAKPAMAEAPGPAPHRHGEDSREGERRGVIAAPPAHAVPSTPHREEPDGKPAAPPRGEGRETHEKPGDSPGAAQSPAPVEAPANAEPASPPPMQRGGR